MDMEKAQGMGEKGPTPGTNARLQCAGHPPYSADIEKNRNTEKAETR